MQACYAINQDTKSLTTKSNYHWYHKTEKKKKKDKTKWQKIDDDGGDNYGARVNLELFTIRKNNELSIEIRETNQYMTKKWWRWWW